MAQQRKVLVTGGAGLIGSRLVRTLLKEGQRVRVLDIRYGELDDETTNPNVEFVGIGGEDLHGGILDKRVVEESVRDVDVIYHLAINWDGASWKHAQPVADLFNVNIRGTLGLLEAARSVATKHFIFLSSVAVYGRTERTIAQKPRTEKLRTDEETACWPELWCGDPGPAYAILKLTTEKLCLMYHYHYGLPVTVFRVEYVFVDKKELRDGANIHVDDVVRALLLAELNKSAYGQVFNLAYPTPHISVEKLQRALRWTPLATTHFLKT
jgi:UDP-glucose 4-epimerase